MNETWILTITLGAPTALFVGGGIRWASLHIWRAFLKAVSGSVSANGDLVKINDNIRQLCQENLARAEWGREMQNNVMGIRREVEGIREDNRELRQSLDRLWEFVTTAKE